MLTPEKEFRDIGLLVAKGLYDDNRRGIDLPNGKGSGRKFLSYKDAKGELHPNRKEFAEWFAESTVPKSLLDRRMTRIGGAIHIAGCWCWIVLIIGDDSDTKDTLSK